MEAELVTLELASSEAKWLTRLLSKAIGVDKPFATVLIHCDNKAALVIVTEMNHNLTVTLMKRLAKRHVLPSSRRLHLINYPLFLLHGFSFSLNLTWAGTTKRSKVKLENDVAGISDGLDTLANLAILSVGEEHTPSTKTTTKHPRHRAGCTCIVCIQPPSGKGPKHKEECACNVCLTVKRRFKTLQLKREKRDPEQDIQYQSTEMCALIQSCSTSTWKDNSPQKAIVSTDAADEESSEQRKPLPSPLKAQIDLNIQPEREEEPSPVASASGMSRAFPHVIN